MFIPLLIWGFFECTIDLGRDYSSLLSGPLHLWYLTFLLKSFLITYIYDGLLIKKPYIIIPIICIFLIIKLFFYSGQFFITYYPYFLLGIGLENFTSKSSFNKRFVYFSLGCSSILYFISSLSINIVVFAMLFNACLFLFFYVSKFPPIPRLINSIDKSSMGIYLMHHPIMWNFVATDWGRNYLIKYQYITPILLIIFTFLITWFISYLLIKTKYLKFIIG